MSEMNLKDLNKVARMSEDDLIDLHFTVGMWIRDNFVYPRNDNLLQSCREVSRDKYLHFAQMHMVIIRELWKKLQKTHKLKVVVKNNIQIFLLPALILGLTLFVPSN